MSMSEAGRLGWLAAKETLERKNEERRRHWARKCQNCSDPIPYGKYNVFCTRSCAATHNNRAVPKRKRKGSQGGCCLYCSKPLVGNQAKFCSSAHMGLLSKKLRWDKALDSGDASLVGGPSAVKLFLKSILGETCGVCSGKDWCGRPIPLVMDHIDGDSSNWKISNLRLVCGNCDMQLPTYKSKNRGNGRAFRRQRYAEGKSY